MVTKYTFYIGLNDKDSRIQEVDTLAAYKLVQRVFMLHGVDGATITGGHGIYRHNSAEINASKTARISDDMITEYSIIVQVFEFGDTVPVRAICEDLKHLLNQESIAVERRETDSMLY